MVYAIYTSRFDSDERRFAAANRRNEWDSTWHSSRTIVCNREASRVDSAFYLNLIRT